MFHRPTSRWLSFTTLACSFLSLLLTVSIGVARQSFIDENIEGDGAEAGDAFSEKLYQSLCSIVQSHFYDRRFTEIEFPRIRELYSKRFASANSREDIAPLVNQLLAELKTSHTAFWNVDQLEFYYLVDIFKKGPTKEFAQSRFPNGVVRYEGIGVLPLKSEDKWFAAGVLEGSIAERAGMLRGDELVVVDSEPYDPVRSFRGKSGLQSRVGVRRTAGGPVLELEMKIGWIEPQSSMLESLMASMRIEQVEGKRIAYAHMWSYAGGEFQNALREALQSGVLSDADALVLDLREGWGGASPEYLNLFNRNVPVLEMVSREGEKASFSNNWMKPVVLLVNGRSKSGKEVLAYGFKKFGLGMVVGERTAGAVVAGAPFVLDEESILYLAVNDVMVDGQRLEGVGVEPDVLVREVLEYSQGKDEPRTRSFQIAAEQASKQNRVDRASND